MAIHSGDVNVSGSLIFSGSAELNIPIVSSDPATTSLATGSLFFNTSDSEAKFFTGTGIEEFKP